VVLLEVNEMRKAEAFGRVLDLLDDKERDKLWISAQRLIRAQKAVKTALPKRQRTAKKEELCMEK
jgi:hypothetical protein